MSKGDPESVGKIKMSSADLAWNSTKSSTFCRRISKGLETPLTCELLSSRPSKDNGSRKVSSLFGDLVL